MNIALDYDGTYTADPTLWDYFISKCLSQKHKVMIVTGRNEQNKITDPSLKMLKIHIYYTYGVAKNKYMKDLGIKIDVWIDDNPFYIDHDRDK